MVHDSNDNYYIDIKDIMAVAVYSIVIVLFLYLAIFGLTIKVTIDGYSQHLIHIAGSGEF